MSRQFRIYVDFAITRIVHLKDIGSAILVFSRCRMVIYEACPANSRRRNIVTPHVLLEHNYVVQFYRINLYLVIYAVLMLPHYRIRSLPLHS